MPHIITATDFSEVGTNAVHYACKLAAAQQSQVVIIHSFIIPVMFSDIPIPGSLITDAQGDADVQMKKLVAEMKAAYPGLSISGNVIYGETTDAIYESADGDDEPWLIVIGNNSPGDNMQWPDSTLMTVFKKMDYPVLAIPPAYSYSDVNKLCFAFDNKHTGNALALRQINELKNRFNAELHVVNIQPRSAHSIDAIDADAKASLAAADPEYHFVADTDDIDQAIQDFTKHSNIDWLIMIPRKHSFFEGLFHKSHTKAIAHHSHIPILALHEKE